MAIHTYTMLKHKLRKAGAKLMVSQESSTPFQRKLGIRKIEGHQFQGKNEKGQFYNVQIEPDGMFVLGVENADKTFALPPKKFLRILKNYRPYQKNMPKYEKTFRKSMPNLL